MKKIKDLESLLETLDIVSDKRTMKAVRKSQKESEEGKILTHEEVWETCSLPRPDWLE